MTNTKYPKACFLLEIVKAAILAIFFLFVFSVSVTYASAAGLNKRNRHTAYYLDETLIYASKKYGLPLPFIVAVMRAESGFDIYAVSPKGAIGLMQVMPQTGKMMRQNIDNPVNNIIAGAKYLHYCLKRFGFKPVPALACYNAGPDSIRTVYIKNRRKFIIPPYRQTEIYIMRVYKYYNYYRKLLK